MRIVLVTAAALGSACALAGAGLELREIPGQAPLGQVEIHGLAAGPFDPANWRANRLNWSPDVRVPFIAPRRGGGFRNIYAPSVTREPYGWRLFYGAWDGVPTGNDRIYSVTTPDFVDFDDHATVIEHGVFIHVCNVNVQKLEDGSYHMICTAYPDTRKQNKPIYFSSPDGRVWNGTPQPHVAAMPELVEVRGYDKYADADLNGANVLLRDRGRWLLYFNNWKDPGKLYWAEGGHPKTFTLRGVALETNHAVNDVKRFHAGGKDWYVMGLHKNTSTLWYSLSNDGRRFEEPKVLFRQLYPEDKYIVAIGFACQGDRLLGVIYGAGPVPELNRNRLFARWLQKKVLLSGATEAGALGPDRQLLNLAGEKPLEGQMKVLAEDGATPLASGPVKLRPGRIYQLTIR